MRTEHSRMIVAFPSMYILRSRPSLVKRFVGGLKEGCGAFLTEHFWGLQGRNTPLHIASWEGRAAVVEKLLAAGAVVDATDEVRAREGRGNGRGRGATHCCSCLLCEVEMSQDNCSTFEGHMRPAPSICTTW